MQCSAPLHQESAALFCCTTVSELPHNRICGNLWRMYKWNEKDPGGATLERYEYGAQARWPLGRYRCNRICISIVLICNGWVGHTTHCAQTGFPHVIVKSCPLSFRGSKVLQSNATMGTCWHHFLPWYSGAPLELPDTIVHLSDISHILLDLLLVKVGDIQITAQIKMQVTYIQITFSHENMASLIAIDIFSREGCIHVNI